jgi:acetyltransferase-like isoleucine patch superfamily enzyme
VPDALTAALPSRASSGSLRERWADRRHQRFFLDAYRRSTTPPPPHRWARFGAAYVVPPDRISRPDCIWIGDGVVVLEDVWMSVVQGFDDITPRLVLEDRARVGRGCQFSVVGEVVVESEVLIGDFVQIGDTSHPYTSRIRASANTRPQPVRIGRRAMLGSHVTVLAGVTVGAGAVIDHHAVVTADVPAGAVVRGNPAKEVMRDSATS